MTTPEALALVLRRLDALGRELGRPELGQADAQTRLFGAGACLDSLGLVTLMADLEEDIIQATGRSVVLADEKALSALTSPFRRAGLLAEHIARLTSQA